VEHLTETSSCKSPVKKMHLGVIGVIRGLLGFGSKSKISQGVNTKQDDHVYIRGNIADRGPCPALNALSNQGYL